MKVLQSLLAAALAELIADDGARGALERAGLERARSFSWARTAAQTADVLRAAAMPR